MPDILREDAPASEILAECIRLAEAIHSAPINDAGAKLTRLHSWLESLHQRTKTEEKTEMEYIVNHPKYDVPAELLLDILMNNPEFKAFFAGVTKQKLGSEYSKIEKLRIIASFFMDTAKATHKLANARGAKTGGSLER